ncbi:MAG TPA: Fe-S cluster protein [Firmicutes bacterium]|jgi:uncharacterized Fe-S cluster-containing protein|nr:Fe-S cluster protein [Bacillota bacterium]
MTVKLPGMNCGLCGYRTCEEFMAPLAENPELSKRCIYLSENRVPEKNIKFDEEIKNLNQKEAAFSAKKSIWKDTLGRDFDFFLESFPEDPGPREIIIPHNPMLTREMEIQKGEVLIGRPLGMSCGCPVTHCGIVRDVDHRTGIIQWCVTGPLHPREKGYKDLGYYIAEGYEGLVKESKVEPKIGMRYFFQPRMCMMHWRHSGLVNYINKAADGLQIRIEGLWIG